jgi:hypothetical protein
MIEYRQPAEREILFHYANNLKDAEIIKILNQGGVENAVEARQLASFFWKMVDLTVLDSDNEKTIAGQSNLESWCEDIMQTLRYHFIETGYMQEWEDESDKVD